MLPPVAEETDSQLMVCEETGDEGDISGSDDALESPPGSPAEPVQKSAEAPAEITIDKNNPEITELKKNYENLAVDVKGIRSEVQKLVEMQMRSAQGMEDNERPRKKRAIVNLSLIHI